MLATAPAARAARAPALLPPWTSTSTRARKKKRAAHAARVCTAATRATLRTPGVTHAHRFLASRRSMIEAPAIGRPSGNYMYAASAPATMLWGPTSHRCAAATARARATRPIFSFAPAATRGWRLEAERVCVPRCRAQGFWRHCHGRPHAEQDAARGHGAGGGAGLVLPRRTVCCGPCRAGGAAMGHGGPSPLSATRAETSPRATTTIARPYLAGGRADPVYFLLVG